MELGLFSFAEVPPHGTTRSRLRELVEEAALADAVGLDVFGVGEHHRPDYAASAPAVVLAAIAARTERIRLTSAVTVLSSDDPVRVFQQFATLDQLADGRAEILVGRGSFTESFPLFGQALQDYDTLFSEKLDLLLRLRESERVTWSGRHRPSLSGQGVYPRPVQERLPVWIAVGGTPASVVRAGRLGLPLALAIIGGQPHRFRPLIDLYRQTGAEAGHDPATLRVSINGHGFLADTAAHAAEVAVGPFMETMGRIGRERGWPPPSRAQFESESDARRRARARQRPAGHRQDPVPARAVRPRPPPAPAHRRPAPARRGAPRHRDLRPGGRAGRPPRGRRERRRVITGA